MNELQLSNDLTTIETEIKSYQNIAGQSIFEIGRRLKHVKENDLAHGEFVKWLERVNITRDYSSKYMRVYEEFNNSNVVSTRHLGVTALNELAQIPEIERTKEHTTSKGEVKTPDEMTVRELRELKKQLKQRDEQNAHLQSQVEQAQRSEEIAKKQLEDAESKEPEVIEKYMEPEDYNQLKQSNQQLQDYLQEVSNHNKQLKSDIERLKNERSETDEKSAKYDQLNEAINKMNGQLTKGQQKIKAQKEVYDLVRASEKLIKEVSPLCYLAYGKDIVDNEYAREPIERIIKDLNDISNRLQKQINQGDVIDV
ncbi:DNA repair exonuclease SbcCD ATPase subunit [Staphylococcus hominis]